jgi:hypothetical protein
MVARARSTFRILLGIAYGNLLQLAYRHFRLVAHKTPVEIARRDFMQLAYLDLLLIAHGNLL